MLITVVDVSRPLRDLVERHTALVLVLVLMIRLCMLTQTNTGSARSPSR